MKTQQERKEDVKRLIQRLRNATDRAHAERE